MRWLACLALVFCVINSRAEEDTLDYFYTPQLGLDKQPRINRMIIHARNTEFDNALAVSEGLMEESAGLQTSHPVAYGQLLINHGVLLAASTRYQEALDTIDTGLVLLEEQLGPFSEDLINAIMAKALTELSLNSLETAEDSFRRAQHITHRQHGVYNGDQFIMLNYLTATSLRRGEPKEADRQQLFSLRVAEEVYGAESIEILPTLSRLGSYFASRGSTIPVMASSEHRIQRDQLFKHAISMYDRALGIVALAHGETDMRLVPHLRGLASARLLQATARRRAEEALLHSLAIIESQPDVPPVDLAQAHVDLGDLYIILSDERSVSSYMTAWELLQESDETREVARALFDVPIRLYPRGPEVFYLERMPDAAEGHAELFVDLEYDVTETGRVKNIRVLDSNVPNEKVRLLRQIVRGIRYRPRIDDGELVITENLRLHQLFRVLGEQFPAVKPESDTDSAVSDDELS